MADPTAELQGDEQFTVTLPIEVHFKRHVMFLKMAGAEVKSGEWAGSDFCTNAGGGSPIVNVVRNGEQITTAWIPVRAILDAVFAEVGRRMATDYVHAVAPAEEVPGA